MVKTRIVINANQRIAVLVSFVWAYAALQPYISKIISTIVMTNWAKEVVIYAIVFSFIVFAINPILHRLQLFDFLFLLFILYLILASIIMFSENRELLVGIIPRFLLTVFPCYFLGRSIQDFNTTINYLYKMSIIVLLISFLYYVFYLGSGRSFSDDNMVFAYNILPSILVILYTALTKGGIIRWIVASGGIIFLIIQGTRGPIVCVMSFFLLYVLFVNTKTKKRFRYMPIILLGILISLSKPFMVWLQTLSILLSTYGVSNRVINMILINEFYQDEVRSYLYEIVINSIKKHPILGNGIMGDRTVLLHNNHYADYYVHNLFLEIWCHFGVVLGSILLGNLLRLIWKSLVKAKSMDNKAFIVILVSLSIVKLMMSGSYLFEPYLFLLIGVCTTWRTEICMFRRSQNNLSVAIINGK